MAEPPDDPIQFRFFNEIGIIEQLSRNLFEQVLPDGLNIPQFTVLNHLTRLGDGRSPAEMARSFQITKGAMTNTLQRMEKKGLIDIRPDAEDGRVKRVSLTAAGHDARAKSIQALAPLAMEFSEAIPEYQLKAVLPQLQKVREYLDTNRQMAARTKKQSPPSGSQS